MSICRLNDSSKILLFLILIAENRRVNIIGDSIIKNMPTIDGVVVKCFPGYNIVKLTMKLDKTLKGHIELSPFDYIIVHVGTNNIDRRDSYDNIIADYGNLIRH